MEEWTMGIWIWSFLDNLDFLGLMDCLKDVWAYIFKGSRFILEVDVCNLDLSWVVGFWALKMISLDMCFAL